MTNQMKKFLQHILALLTLVLCAGTVSAAFSGITGEFVGVSEFGYTYRIYAQFTDSQDRLTAIFSIGTSEPNPHLLTTSVNTSLYQSPFGGSFAHGINPVLFGILPDLVYDSWLTLGSAEGQAEVFHVGMTSALAAFETGTGFVLDGGSWFAQESSSNANAGDDLKVLIGQFTIEPDGNTPGELELSWNLQWRTSNMNVHQEFDVTFTTADIFVPIPGCLDPEAINFDPEATEDDGTCLYQGCTDPIACNYDETAALDDGSCSFALGYCEYCVDGEPAYLDADGDGICDPDEVVGCMDPIACNYDPVATDYSTCDYCPGCTDPIACNFDPGAFTEDGTCVYPFEEFCEFCEDGLVVFLDEDFDGICDPNEIAGCQDDTACNYNPAATDGDDSCDYFSCVILDCMDPNACNFNPEADYSDGSCEFPDPGLDCDGNCNFDADGDGICDGDEIAGCLDPDACDFDPAATDEGPCESYADQGYDCDGLCVLDVNNNGLCDPEEIVGCLEADACNYDPEATLSDDFCEFLSCAILGCMDENACNFDSEATMNNGSCTYPAIGLDCDGNCMEDADGDGICDGDELVGCQDASALNFDPSATDNGDCTYPEPAPDEFAFTPTAGSGLFIGQITFDGEPASASDWIAAFDEDGNCAGAVGVLEEAGLAYASLVIYADDATTSDADEGMNAGEGFTLKLFNAASGAVYTFYDAFGQEIIIGWTNTNGAPMPGLSNPDAVFNFSSTAYVPACLDTEACNFDPTSLSSDNCLYPEIGYDCAGVCLSDADADGICDANEIVGCMDAAACDYNSQATEAGSCSYPESGYDCAGACLADADGDGVCDANELPGCTDPQACNYSAVATDDDGSCNHPLSDLVDCFGNCFADIDGDGICDGDEIPGCTDDEACNFDPTATDNDGSCLLPATGYDCNGDCLADADGDGVCDLNEVSGCLDSAACNYDPDATDAGDCLTNDAVGVCGGGCLADDDGDGLCDDVDPCVGAFDACGVCNGPGAVYGCGCEPIPDGDCDCNGNALDAVGECGGACVEDLDADGVCDDVDPCVGALDACGVCNGPGAIYECGCSDIPNGDCDCLGNQLDALGVCGGLCQTDFDQDGVCDSEEIPGCTDEWACNFDSEATEDDGTCFYAAENLDCAGECLNDGDGDGVCDELEIAGCTEQTASNFNPSATDEDGSCLFPSPPPSSFDFVATPASGTMFGQATLDGATAEAYDWIAAFDASGNCAGSAALLINGGVAYINLTIYGDDPTTADVDEGLTGNEPFQLVLWDESASTTIVYSNDAGPVEILGWSNTNGAPIPGLNSPDSVYDFSSENYQPNCNDPQACNFDPQATIDLGCVYPEFGYGCDGNCLADADGDGICNPFEVSGCTSSAACNYNPQATDDSGNCIFPELGYDCNGECLADSDMDGICDALEMPGCTDETACNFLPAATDDNGSCFYATDDLDCNGNCFDDIDGDGICDADEIAGCMVSIACNYEEDATDDDGSCLFPSTGYDCNGNCLFDDDEDGICDEFEGCTDPNACNFNEDALDDNGSCTYPSSGYDCAGNCLHDADGDGVCDDDEMPGCTYPSACNFDASATDDDGTCLFVPLGYDCALNCLADADNDGICDQDEFAACTDPTAINYVQNATDDDGSCAYETCASDLDGDGVVNIGDILMLLADFETVCNQ